MQQIAGLFDVPLAAEASERFTIEVPGTDEPWDVGLIVGPSGSGKTTIARHAFGTALAAVADWPADRAVVDAFPADLGIKDITGALTAVGFSSPPAWVKPYAVLSNGERFRCDLARALLCGGPLVIFDEFTSVVDRTVAKVGSAAVAKAVRGQRLGCRRFVAVSCHYDIAEWLEPDWVVDMATAELARGRLQRPSLRLEIHRCHHAAWRLFARHHYLSADLNRAARCYLGTIDGEPVAFVAVLSVIGRAKHWRISRVVVLPDYQGVGIGGKVIEAVGLLYAAEGDRLSITASHPSVIRHCERSPMWRLVAVNRGGRGCHRGSKSSAKTSAGRCIVSFEYVPQSVTG